MSRWPIAASTFIWHSPLSTAILESRLPQLAAWGFDAVELPLDQPGDWDVERCSELLAELGLASVVCTVFSPGRELAAAPAQTQERTARAASIWRPLAASPDALAVEGLAFLRQATGPV